MRKIVKCHWLGGTPRIHAKYLVLIFLTVVFCLKHPTMVYAEEIIVDYPKEPTITKTIRWSLSGGADEYRFLTGAYAEDDFDQANGAGSGGQVSIVVDENGTYTLYARKGERVFYVQIPVTTIDHTPPTIRITDIVSTPSGHISVYYEIDDYYGVSEVRYLSGNMSESGFSAASIVTGGVIAGLTEGDYTLYAKDTAGNITTYAMAVASDYTESEWSTEYETRYEAYASTEWAKSNLWVDTSYEDETTAPESTEEEISRNVPAPSEEAPDIPINPIVAPEVPPVERYPQTGSTPVERFIRAGSIYLLFIAGIALLLISRDAKNTRKEENEKDPGTNLRN